MVRPNLGWLLQQRVYRRSLLQEGGNALVEFALSLTVLLMLTFGMIDLCRAVYTLTAVQAAAQVGARAGLIDLAQVTPAVQQRLVALDPAQAQVTATVVNNAQVQVQVTYPFEFITPYLSRLVTDGKLELSSQATMAIQ
jgi:Flp pilus assembly protein TadG